MSTHSIAVQERYWYPALGILLLFALWLRWPYPEPEWIHIDENVFVINPLKLWSGDFNPHFFIYPTLHIYLCSALYYFYYLFWHTEPIGQFVAYHFFVDGGELIEIARGFNTVLSASTALVVAGIGRRLYGVLGGILAGLFFSVLPLSVRFAHLASTDSAAVLWIAMALLGGVRVVQQGRTRDYAFAGICAGLAGATKYPAALICIPLAFACFLNARRIWQQGLLLTACLAMVTFIVTAPYVVLDMGKAWEDLSEMGQVHLMSELASTNMPSGVYYLRYALRYGVGFLGLGMAILSLLWPGKSREEWLIVTATVVFALLLLMAESVFMRYALPLAPLFALLWTRLVWARQSWVMVVIVIALVAEPLYASLQTRRLLSGDDTREEAKHWLDGNVASGTRVVNLPPRVGNIEVLYPEYVLAREGLFAQSFRGRDLLSAYGFLAQQENLPPLYMFLKPDAILGQLNTAEPDTSKVAFILSYQHPACSKKEVPGERELLEKCIWIEEFSPGDLAKALYEPVDWYFAPISDFAAVERTGPLIKLGRVMVEETGGQGDAREFFKILHGILEGKVLTVAGAWEEAMDVYAEIERTPFPLADVLNLTYLYDFLYSYGLCHSELGNVAQALSLWEQALILREDDAILRNNLGVAHIRLGQAEKAVIHLSAATELDPKFAEAYFNLGNVLYRQHDREGALAAWQGAVSANPSFSKAYYNLGNVHYDRREWDQALRAYKKARVFQADESRIHYNIAQTYLKKVESDSAIAAFHQVLEIDKSDAEVHFRLGVLYLQKGMEQKGYYWLAKSQALEPEHPRTVQIQAYLKKGL